MLKKKHKFSGFSLTIKARLIIVLVLTVLAFAFLSFKFYTQTNMLGSLQNESNKRSDEAMLIQKVAFSNFELYNIIADTIINKSISGSEEQWKAEKLNKSYMFIEIEKLVRTPEQKDWIGKAKKDLNDFIAIYESIILPEMKKPEPSAYVISTYDETLDRIGADMRDNLDKLSVSMINDAKEADLQFERVKQQANMTNLIICIIISALISLMCFIIINNISKSIKYVNNELLRVADGDLSIQFNSKYALKKDEIGQLIQSVSHAVGKLNALLKSVNQEAGNTQKSVSNVNNYLTELNGEVQDISATTEQLSAGMEAAAASAHAMHGTVEEIEKAVEAIAIKAQDGAETAGEINTRAAAALENTLRSQNDIKEVYQRTQTEMNTAIEKTKTIEQIKVLSETILQIADQTNLLALNAAIEAARAGEAGKGFAVVANEIKKLAEGSKDAVSKIQQTIKTIVGSVSELTESAVEMLQFIDISVLKDYEALVDICRQYSKDAVFYSDMSTDLSATTEELTSAIENTTRAIGGIADSSNEAASGTQNIAEKNIVITQKASEILAQTEDLRRGVENLVAGVSKFKV